jgi:serine/threonine protein kinase
MVIKTALEALVVGKDDRSRRANRSKIRKAAGHILTHEPNAYANRYRNIKFVDEGGVGMVYKAIDRKTGKPVATKFLIPISEWSTPQSDNLVKFKREFQIIKSLQGEPHVVQLASPKLVVLKSQNGDLPRALPAGMAPTWYGYTLKLYSGELGELVYKYGNSMRMLNAVLPQALAGLQAIHRHGYVHHDVKLSNFLYGDGMIVISDFGLTVNRNKVRVAKDGALCDLAGTKDYMSLAEAQHRAAYGVGCNDPYADIESLANTLYRAFVDEFPWEHVKFEDSIPLRERMYERPPGRERTVKNVILQLGYDARHRRVAKVSRATLAKAVADLRVITGVDTQKKDKTSSPSPTRAELLVRHVKYSPRWTTSSTGKRTPKSRNPGTKSRNPGTKSRNPGTKSR